MRSRTERIGRGATTNPACSALASDPGEASRSSITAIAIVAGIAIASACTTNPSAPQFQSDSPSARRPPRIQPSTPEARATDHPRRTPSRRSETDPTAKATIPDTKTRTVISTKLAAITAEPYEAFTCGVGSIRSAQVNGGTTRVVWIVGHEDPLRTASIDEKRVERSPADVWRLVVAVGASLRFAARRAAVR